MRDVEEEVQVGKEGVVLQVGTRAMNITRSGEDRTAHRTAGTANEPRSGQSELRTGQPHFSERCGQFFSWHTFIHHAAKPVEASQAGAGPTGSASTPPPTPVAASSIYKSPGSAEAPRYPIVIEK